MSNFYKKYVNYIVGILLVMCWTKSCKSLSLERELEWNENAYRYEIELLENKVDRLEYMNDRLEYMNDSLEIKIDRLEYKLRNNINIHPRRHELELIENRIDSLKLCSLKLKRNRNKSRNYK